MKSENTTKIEELFKEHIDPSREGMGEDLRNIFFNLMMADMSEEHEKVAEMYAEIKQKSWVLQAMELRVKHMLTIEIEKDVMLLLLVMANQRIGSAMVLLYYMQYWAKRLDVKNITLDDYVQKIFPLGVPSEEAMKNFWEAQKVKLQPDNMIDHKVFTNSIMH